MQIEEAVSGHPHIGVGVTRFITHYLWIPESRGAVSWGKGSSPSQVVSEQEMENRVACTDVGGEATNFSPP